MTRFLRSVSSLALLIVCTCTIAAPVKHAPNLEFKDLSGKTQKIATLRGSIAVVNFWATWCGPCREELPMLSRLASDYRQKGVRFIAASADERKNLPQVARFIETSRPDLDVWVGADLYMLDHAGMGNLLPATMILDTHGDIAARFLGEAREPEIRAVLDWLLSGRQGTAPPSLFQHE